MRVNLDSDNPVLLRHRDRKQRAHRGFPAISVAATPDFLHSWRLKWDLQGDLWYATRLEKSVNVDSLV